MHKDWFIHYTTTRYMGTGIEVLVQVPYHRRPSVACRRTAGDWDLPMLASEPASAQYTGELTNERAEALYQKFASATIGAMPPSETTIDADAHSLVFMGGLANRVEFKWSIQLPPCWAELAGIAHDLTALAEELL
jgi:hypothetical protein